MVDLPDETRDMKDKAQDLEGDMFDRNKPDTNQQQESHTDPDAARDQQQE